jgi:replicative DNA helicase
MERLTPLSEVFTSAEKRVLGGDRAVARVWPTGFDPLDEILSGGLRAGELVLVGGPQGLGKTSFALQVLRNIAADGGDGVCFSYELDEGNLLERLLVQEAYDRAGAAAPTLKHLRSRLELLGAGQTADALSDALGPLPGMPGAQEALRTYGERLSVHASSTRSTTTEIIRELVLEAVAAGRAPVVVVDYLQKVSIASSLGEDERVTLVVEALKDLAIEAQVPVIAVVAATSAGLAPGHRLRVHELRGSSALAYEADVILLFNDKHNIVAKHHLAYDPRSAERFRQVAVLSVEKNRTGRSDIHLEFRKEFEYCRFDPIGNLVSEQLVDGRLTAE